ncbi:lipopolysaccharide export system protein LptA [Paenochrobactrum gallinarii]|uniref:Lipopolysaccharide export system protein LptA n=1 Tax=Paenochrobactrum gallinarii TaxID=643673 RepID=A0A841M600_9HYPH|nr:lipopolysaccharide export system protein LptA [Paenochrobactrum gallinarii]
MRAKCVEMKQSAARFARSKTNVWLAAAGMGLALSMSPLSASAQTEQVPFGSLNLSSGKEPVKIDADRLEMRDKEGIAIFMGNVSVVQGETVLRAGKMTVHYNKGADKSESGAQQGAAGLSASGIDRLEVSEKVYLKSGPQVATGDTGVYNAKTQQMVLQGKKVVLTDGDNVATGCKMTAHMDTGKAFLEACPGAKKGRVSIIMSPKSEDGGAPANKR